MHYKMRMPKQYKMPEPKYCKMRDTGHRKSGIRSIEKSETRASQKVGWAEYYKSVIYDVAKNEFERKKTVTFIDSCFYKREAWTVAYTGLRIEEMIRTTGTGISVVRFSICWDC